MKKSKTKYLTLIFENCEDLSVGINPQVSFHIEELKKGYNLNHESCEMEGYTYFEKGYLVLPKNCSDILQSDFSNFINKEVTLERVTKYNDITSVHLPKGSVFYPKFDGETDNSFQKSYVTEDGNILVDWGDCFKNSENIYFKSSNEEEMLQLVDSHCNY